MLKYSIVNKNLSSLVEQVASHMEVGAELFFYEWLARSGHAQMIPTLPSQDLFLWMVDFTENEAVGPLKEKLTRALSGVSAVWKFRNVLYHEDAANARWERFKRQKLLNEATRWLETA